MGLTIACVFNDPAVRRHCLDRSLEAYDGPVEVEYLPIDNTTHAYPTAGAALNHAVRMAHHDVVVLVHAGLDQLVSPIDIWDAIPVLHQPMSIHWWVASAGTVPADHREILTWVDDIWGEVDAWVEAELKDVTPIPPSPTP